MVPISENNRWPRAVRQTPAEMFGLRGTGRCDFLFAQGRNKWRVSHSAVNLHGAELRTSSGERRAQSDQYSGYGGMSLGTWVYRLLCEINYSSIQVLRNEAPRSSLLRRSSRFGCEGLKLRGLLRNSQKPLPSFAQTTEGSPRLAYSAEAAASAAKAGHPRSELRGIRRRRIKFS